VLSRADRTALIWLRFHWGQEYAVNLCGSVWTAMPLSDPWLVLSEPTAARLQATMFLDAAARRMRSGATAARWASFTSPTPEQDGPPSQAGGDAAPQRVTPG
jgi:hypothetical protein